MNPHPRCFPSVLLSLNFLAEREEISGRQFEELIDIGVLGCLEGADESSASGREVIAVRLGNFGDEPVGAQQGQLASDRGGLPSLLKFVLGLSKESLAQVAIAQAMLSLSLSGSKLDVARLPQSEFRQKAGSFEGNSAGTDDLAFRRFAGTKCERSPCPAHGCRMSLV